MYVAAVMLQRICEATRDLETGNLDVYSSGFAPVSSGWGVSRLERVCDGGYAAKET